MINSIDELFLNIFNSLNKEKLKFDKIDGINEYNYSIDKIIMHDILKIIFEICSFNEYCFSINRENYGQVNITIFEKNKNTNVTLNFFIEPITNVHDVIEKKYKKGINKLKKLKIIPVIGPDGVGKSTILDEIIDTLEEKVFFKRFKKVVRNSIIYNIFHPFNKNSVRKKVGKKSVKNQHDDIHYLLCIISGLSAYPYLIFQSLFKKRIVFLDRFFYDYLLENISFLNKKTNLRKNWKFLLKIIPRVNFLIHLDADAKLILSRKQELSEDDIIKYRKLNFDLYLEKPAIMYLYVNTALEIEHCKEIILNTGVEAKVFKKT